MPTASEQGEQQRQDLAAIAAAFGPAFLPIWLTLNPRDMSGTLDDTIDQLWPLVYRYSNASAYAARLWYEQNRVDAGVRNPYRLPLEEPPTRDAIESLFRQVTTDLWLPPASEQAFVDAVAADTEIVVRKSFEDVILGAARSQTEQAVKRDPRPPRWARIPEPDACAFCMMLATRGAVYASAESAGDGINRYHSRCRCDVVAVHGRWEYAPEVADALDLYKRVTNNVSGKGKARAFRRAWERGGRGGEGREAQDVTPETSQPVSAFDALTLDQIEHQIGVTEPLKNSDWRTKQLARLTKRRDELRAAA